ncbi:ATP-dependent nuclease [Dinghuibacter silviterrae]|nr:ATP-binding protein [Dinghuibacter silviterrae]
MIIEKINLKNLRCFENAELNLSKSLNILVGFNNSGKSTILKSVYSLQELFYLRETDIRAREDSFSIEFEIGQVNKPEQSYFAPAYFHPGIRATTTRYINITLNQSGERESYTLEKRELTADERTYVGDQRKQKFDGFPNREDKGGFIYPFLTTRKKAFISTQGSVEDTFIIRDSQSNLPAKVQKINGIPTINEEFRRLCKTIIGYEVVPIAAQQNGYTLGMYSGPYNTIPIEAMGEGVINIIGLLVNLLTEDGKLFLLEEIENDLHPVALKILLDLIIKKAKNNQVIISTHSDVVLKHLSAIEGAKIFYISQDNTGLAIPTSTIQEVPASPQQRRDILKLLGYDLSDRDLFEGYLLFEESSAERIVRDFIIPNFVPELHHKIGTIAANGVDDVHAKFKHLHDLFLYVHSSPVYKNKAWVIADGDEAGKRNIEKMQNDYKKSWSPEHFVCLSEEQFERYYPALFQQEVERIFSIQNKKIQRDEKLTLLNQVLEWLQEDKKRAKKALDESAKEVIELFQKIATALK